MCGFAGIVDLNGRHGPPSREFLTAMVSTLAHRGPDEFGLYRDDQAGMSHARLSLIDLASGQQPMLNADGSHVIVFNGEIYNHVELRAELEAAGRTFRTRSDTEVLLVAYIHWGPDAFARFNGQWAAAIWDRAKRELVLTRDQFGICPMFIRQAGGKVAFASEVKALLAEPDAPRAIDPRGLDQTFAYWASVAPQSMFEGVEELRPGAFRRYRPGDTEAVDQVWWRPSFPKPREAERMSVEDAADELLAKLKQATRLRLLRADVPVGAYLSGGIDSSVTATLADEAAPGQLHTFSLAFEDAEFDESVYQKRMAQELGSSHEMVTVKRSDIAEVFPEVIWHAERPVLRTAPAPMFLLSKLVRQRGVKAVLTGEGADEVLAGYDIFREAKIREFWARDPDSQMRPALLDRLYPYMARSPAATRKLTQAFWTVGFDKPDAPGFSHLTRWSGAGRLRRFYSPETAASLASRGPPDILLDLPQDYGSWDSLGRAQFMEMKSLLAPYILSSQGDRMLLGNSVEGRFPFLDQDVVAFAATMPSRYKLSGLSEKKILKRLARDLLPAEIVDRVKQPYRAPDAASFVSPGAPDYVAEALSVEAVKAAGLFQPQAVQGLYDKAVAAYRSGNSEKQMSNADNSAFVGVLSAQLLHEQFIGRRGRPDFGRISFKTDIDRTSSSLVG
jgi:asparagine synthase (glutamine-hydrolysing)